MPSTKKLQMAKVLVASSKAEVGATLNPAIVDICLTALKERGVFTIALSGGSLPNFLAGMPAVFGDRDPQFHKWHVLLADERCVPVGDKDSNLGALQANLFSKLTPSTIPDTQIYGIDESKIGDTEGVARAYVPVVEKVLALSGGQLDLAVLGFGPDGHTCSLFPGHKLLEEHSVLVAPIEDSPKPPPCRITLTLKVLNTMTRNVVYCGAGGSKTPILEAIFSETKAAAEDNQYYYTPCALVAPLEQLIWVVDADAMPKVE
jgi:6-phosphogluconolactonase